MHRPALSSVVVFGLGILLSHFIAIPITYIAIALLIFSCSYLGLGIAKSKYLNLCPFIMIAITGALWYSVRTSIFHANHIKNYLYLTNEVRIVSQIIRDPEVRENTTILECLAESLFIDSNSIRTSGKIQISLKYPTQVF
ncbi:MAG: DUF4131 domain-containing protein, partial [Candidatus Stahlbacteria bacterium]|nr:DUF4131 domain-containing protein [Candidatus Stahlbacteria bacterium]